MKDISLLILNNLIEDVVAVEPESLVPSNSPIIKGFTKLYGSKGTNKVIDPILDTIEKKYNIPNRGLQFPISGQERPIPRRYEGETTEPNVLGTIKGTALYPMYNQTVSGPIPRGISREELHAKNPAIPLQKG